MQKIIVEIADVVLASANTALTHLGSQFPQNQEIQKVVAEALPAIQAVQSVLTGLGL